MPPTPRTPSSTPPLSEAARHLVYPDTIVTSGWPKIRAQAAEMDVYFDPWQDSLGTIVFGKDSANQYAATVGGVNLSIPRQVGKTFFVGMVLIAMCALYPGLTVLWTAQHGKTITKTFQTMQGMVRRRKIWPHIAHNGIRVANGEQQVRFANGSVIMFGAREFGFGRGFDKVDVEVFDEAQDVSSKALEDMVPATNQSQHESGALLFFMGTPPRPDIDDGEEFTNRRNKALEGKMTSGVYVEFSADADADPDDRGQWAKANPSFPARTPVAAMLRMRENLTNDASFIREALGVWDSTEVRGVIPFDAWSAQVDTASMPVDCFALGVEVAPDLARASVALAGRREDGGWHVELDEQRQGAAWVVSYVKGLVDANPQIRSVMIDVGGPAKALVDDFAKARVNVTAIRVAELGSACSRVLDGSVTGWLRSTGQPQLDESVRVAGKRPLGDTGMWVFSRKDAVSDITPIQAVTLALHGAQNSVVNSPSLVRKKRRVVVSE